MNLRHTAIRYHLTPTIAILCLTLSSFLCGAAVRAQDSKESSEFKLAIGLYNDGMYDLAAEQFKNFIDAYPSTAQGIEARFYLGSTLMKLQRYEEARITFQNFALTYVEHPKAAEAWMSVGDAFLGLHNEREAASAYERVKTFCPKSPLVPEALLKAGRLFRLIGERETAKKDFRSIIQDYPASGQVLDARLAIGEMYAEEGQTDLAEREARRVSESDASPAVKAAALFSIARLQTMMSLFDDAGATLTKVTTTYRKTPVALAAAFELGKLAMSAHSYASAAGQFEKVSSDAGADDSLRAEAFLGLGDAAMGRREYRAARQAYEKLIERLPRSSLVAEAHLRAAIASLDDGDGHPALAHTAAVLGEPSSPLRRKAMILAARASTSLHQYGDAARSYLSFIEHYPDDQHQSEVLLALARLYEENSRDYRKAMGVFDQILQKYPQSRESAEALMGVGRCQEALGDYDAAVKTYRDLETHYPAIDHPDGVRTALDNLINHKIKDRDAGIEKLARLMGEVLTQQSKAELSFKLGEIYYHDLKDYASAAGQFKAAIEGGLDAAKSPEAAYLRARSLDLASDTGTGSGGSAIGAYDDFLREYPATQWSGDAAFFRYRLIARSSPVSASIAAAKEFLVQHPASVHEDDVLYDFGRRALQSGDTADAIAAYRRLITGHPQSPWAPPAMLDCGILFEGGHQADSAAILWQKIADSPAANPSTAAALWNLAELFCDSGKWAEAIPLLKRLASEFPYSSYADKANLRLPEAYVENGEYDEAIGLFSAMIAFNASSPFPGDTAADPYYFIAGAYQKKGDRQHAIQCYNRYLGADRTGAYADKALYALGEIFRAQGNVSLTTSYFREAAALGQSGTATPEIADLLFRTEQYAEAAKQYGQLARAHDSGENARIYLEREIVATYRMDKPADAARLIADFEAKYGKDKTTQSEFLYERGLQLYRAKEYPQARKEFEKLADDFENSHYGPWGRFYIAKIAEVGNKLEDAAKRYQQILKDYPSSDVIPRTLLSLGNMHFNAERYADAITYYKQIVGAPETAGDILPYAMNNLIEAYESMKLYDAALKLTRDFIDRYPNDDSIIDKKIKLGTLYAKTGFYDQAILFFQNLIGEAGSTVEAEIRYDIGEAYYDKGDYQQAILEFLKVPYLVSRQGKVDWTATSFYMAGQSYEKMSKFDEAISMYQQIVDRAGIDATFKAAARKEIERVKSIVSKQTP